MRLPNETNSLSKFRVFLATSPHLFLSHLYSSHFYSDQSIPSYPFQNLNIMDHHEVPLDLPEPMGSVTTTHLKIWYWSYPNPAPSWPVGFITMEKCRHCGNISFLKHLLQTLPNLPNLFISIGRMHEEHSPCRCRVWLPPLN